MDRRVYVHGDSLRGAVRRNPLRAHDVSHTMWGLRTIKLLHHRFVDDPRDLGVDVPRDFRVRFEELTDRLWPLCTELLQVSFHLPSHRDKSGPRVLDRDESVVSSCFFDGYYTFATGPRASDAMFADTSSIRTLYSEIHAGKGPPELTVIRGDRLGIAGESIFESAEAAHDDLVNTIDRFFDEASIDNDSTMHRIVRNARAAALSLLDRPAY